MRIMKRIAKALELAIILAAVSVVPVCLIIALILNYGV